jgi:hypothetical protein
MSSGPGRWDLPDAYRCVECEALIEPEYDLCEDCASGWLDWVAASAGGHTPDTDASRPHPQ